MTRRALLPAIAILISAPAAVAAQGRPVHWHRRSPPTLPPITIFHSPQSANLPTAATIGKGLWQFEVSHRFLPPFSDGASALWGLDGPIYNRLGLSYAPTGNSMVTILRSNLQDNLELSGKVRVLEGGRSSIPYQVAVAGGIAWNTAVSASQGPGYTNDENQAFLQLVLNALLDGRLAVGVVPSLLHNPRIQNVGTPNELTMGFNAQLYFARHLSVLGEWNVSPPHPGLQHDAISFGLEIETGGHFFKLIATNSARPDPTQFLGGTPYAFTPRQWRFGFNITRLLKF